MASAAVQNRTSDPGDFSLAGVRLLPSDDGALIARPSSCAPVPRTGNHLSKALSAGQGSPTHGSSAHDQTQLGSKNHHPGEATLQKEARRVCRAVTWGGGAVEVGSEWPWHHQHTSLQCTGLSTDPAPRCDLRAVCAGRSGWLLPVEGWREDSLRARGQQFSPGQRRRSEITPLSHPIAGPKNTVTKHKGALMQRRGLLQPPLKFFNDGFLVSRLPPSIPSTADGL